MLIVGAGAAGMAAAITAARRGADVTILEANEKPGKKILVSGNGRCNIGNRRIEPSRYHCGKSGFVEEVLKDYPVERVVDFLRGCGIEIVEEKEGKLFPMSRQAVSVVNLMTRECQRLGVEIVTQCKVENIGIRGREFHLSTTKGEYWDRSLLLCSGSPAAPQLGGSNTGMLFAQAMGHRLVPPRPALVALESEERWPARTAGVKVKARVTLRANGEFVTDRIGDLLFTDYGVSGLAILDLSRAVSLRLAAWEYCELSIDLFPEFGKEKLASFLRNRIDTERNLPLPLWLEGILHRKLVPVVLADAGFGGNEREDSLDRKKIGRLVYACKNLSLTISSTRDFRYAEVATGGIDVADVNPKTMESSLIPGLHFAGEILDVDGDRGGFNFHWAWVTGMRAAAGMMDDG
ncbi:NAD(P)/FAD-dependent oxidoreductase [Nitratifractor sp.]